MCIIDALGSQPAALNNRALSCACPLQRFIGQCNLQTDIKEAVFLGQGDRLVACGSDDGRVYIYCAETGLLLRALEADEDVANCCQPHPHCALLATRCVQHSVAFSCRLRTVCTLTCAPCVSVQRH